MPPRNTHADAMWWPFGDPGTHTAASLLALCGSRVACVLSDSATEGLADALAAAAGTSGVSVLVADAPVPDAELAAFHAARNFPETLAACGGRLLSASASRAFEAETVRFRSPHFEADLLGAVERAAMARNSTTAFFILATVVLLAVAPIAQRLDRAAAGAR